MNNQLTIYADEQLVETVEKIFEDLGLDIQLGINIFLKRVVKERGIAFLLQNRSSTTIQLESDTFSNINFNDSNNKEVKMESKSNPFRRNNNEITEDMRNYIWNIFINYKNVSYSEYQNLAKDVSFKTGMNQGSAYIYFVILSCLLEGKFNTRTMKFADLTYYVKRILQECSKIEFAATLKSLEQSIPYWSEHLQGNFAVKVQNLVNQYKPFLSDNENEETKTQNVFTKSSFEKYLINAGYSQYTPAGNPSTVYDYIKRIDKVCTIEKIEWIDIPEKIVQLINEYDKGGIKESIGAESNHAVISALKQAYRCIKQNN